MDLDDLNEDEAEEILAQELEERIQKEKEEKRKEYEQEKEELLQLQKLELKQTQELQSTELETTEPLSSQENSVKEEQDASLDSLAQTQTKPLLGFKESDTQENATPQETSIPSERQNSSGNKLGTNSNSEPPAVFKSTARAEESHVPIKPEVTETIKDEDLQSKSIPPVEEKKPAPKLPPQKKVEPKVKLKTTEEEKNREQLKGKKSTKQSVKMEDVDIEDICPNFDELTFVQKCRLAFEGYKNADNTIAMDGLDKVLRCLGQQSSVPELKSIMTDYGDSDKGTLSFKQFVTMMDRQARTHESSEQTAIEPKLAGFLEQAFMLFDFNQDGAISTDELLHAFELVGEPVTQNEVENLFADYDKSGDNVIYLEDWMQAMRMVNISL